MSGQPGDPGSARRRRPDEVVESFVGGVESFEDPTTEEPEAGVVVKDESSGRLYVGTGEAWKPFSPDSAVALVLLRVMEERGMGYGN